MYESTTSLVSRILSTLIESSTDVPKHHLLHRLDDDSTGTATTVADSSAADLTLLLLQDTQQGGDDTCTAAAKRVTKGHSTTVQVDLALVEAEDLHVGEGNHAKRLVDLVGVDIILRDTGVLQRLGNGQCWGSGELGWSLLCVTPADDLTDGLEAEFLELTL